jgi:hypothetical protein
VLQPTNAERSSGLNEIRLNITMPTLRKIEAEGYGSIKFDEFSPDNMEIELRGPVTLQGLLRTQNLTIDLTGKSEAELSVIALIGERNSYLPRWLDRVLPHIHFSH